MGKVIANCNNSDSDDGNNEHKKRKHKKDLEEIRQNSLAAKRNLRNRNRITKPKSNFMKTLGKFSQQREELENSSHCQNLLLRSNADEKQDHELNLKGFFRGGVKGKCISRYSASQEKLREAILKGDALKLVQSGNFIRRKSDTNSENIQFKFADNPKLQMEFKIFNNSSETSHGVDDFSTSKNTTIPSPILGGMKSFKKKNNAADKIFQNLPSQKNQSPKKKYATKEEKCKRRLFEDPRASQSNQNNDIFINFQQKNTDMMRFIPRKSTPENKIFFSEHIPQENVNKLSQKVNNQINPTDVHLISSYVKTLRIIAGTSFQSLFSGEFEDPLEVSKKALKLTYRKASKDYIIKQTTRVEQNSRSVDRSTISSNSEIMMEPDSAVARAVRKNSEFKNMTLFSESTSESSTSVNNSDDGDTDVSATENDEQKMLKRKRVPSSKGDRSEPEIPSSTIAMVDPQSTKAIQKMDSIHPYRQELFARYLQDINTNSERDAFYSSKNNFKELDNHHHQIQQKEKIVINDGLKGAYVVQKSTKHIPAILRKNRSAVDYVTKEKILLSIEESQKPSELINNSSIYDFNTDNNLKSERTPNCANIEPNYLAEAPKCKYVHMNAKYNQPSRINIPLSQNKRVQRNGVPEKHLFTSPHNKPRNHMLSQNSGLSPVEQQSNLHENGHNIHLFQLSQESYDNNCMPHMVSFGEIQEKTDRLTIRSSQNCSEQTSEPLHFSQESYNPCSKFYNSSDNHMPYNRTQNGIPPEMQTFGEISNTNFDYHPYNPVRCNNGFQMKQPEDYFYNESESGNCCQMSNYEVNAKQNCALVQQQQQQQQQQQHVRQPVKFIAVGGNKMPQRHPLYSSVDTSHSYIHKTSVPNQQQYPQVMMPYCQSRNISNQPCHKRSSGRYALPSTSSDYEYDNIYNINDIMPSNPRELRRNTVNFVPSSMSDQNFMQQPSTSHSTINNQRFHGHPSQMQLPLSPIYSQDEYHRGYYHGNESHAINHAHSQRRNCNMHPKRQ